MAKVRSEKVVSSLPSTLKANTIYYVRVGTGFDIYVTNGTGTIVAFKANHATPFWNAGTTDDAQGEKDEPIWRKGPLGLNVSEPKFLLDINGTASIKEIPEPKKYSKVLVPDDENENQVCAVPFPEGGGSSKSTSLITLTGRLYCYTNNRWIILDNNSYGANYYQWATNGNANADPTISWAALGQIIPEGATIKNFIIGGRVNNVEVSDLELMLINRYPNPLSRWETGMDSNGEDTEETIFRDYFWKTGISTQPAFTGATNDYHLRNYSLDYTFKNLGLLTFAIRPVGTITATRYYYLTITIVIEI